VPSLADYDVIIDAGSDKSDPENAVPFTVKTPAGKVFEQPGNFFFLVAAAKDFATNAKELDESASSWQPTEQDAFTALVVMTPTMSEYFEAWKNSRFVAGDQATEKAFVVASRLQDITDILGGLDLIYASVKPQISSVSSAQANQTGQSLQQLHDFAQKLRDEETGGRRFTADEAETLGSDAQGRAESIAGQISQAAGKLKIPLES